MSSRNEGIDNSLHILKQLEAKLKIRPYEATAIRTEPHDDFQRGTFGVNHSQSSHKLEEVQSSLPKMKAKNQNEYNNIEEVIQENRKLKKYVNCLLKMNDYLKNQLVERERYETQRNYNGNNPEVQLMRMEIEYLKEMNKDKELELRKSVYLQGKKQSTAHNRSSSCYGRSFNLQDYLPPQQTKKPKLKTNKTIKSSTKKKGNKCRLCYL